MRIRRNNKVLLLFSWIYNIFLNFSIKSHNFDQDFLIWFYDEDDITVFSRQYQAQYSARQVSSDTNKNVNNFKVTK